MTKHTRMCPELMRHTHVATSPLHSSLPRLVFKACLFLRSMRTKVFLLSATLLCWPFLYETECKSTAFAFHNQLQPEIPVHLVALPWLPPICTYCIESSQRLFYSKKKKKGSRVWQNTLNRGIHNRSFQTG